MTETQPICDHILDIQYAGPADRFGRRTVHLKCPTCGAESDVLTLKTDEELAAAQALTDAAVQQHEQQQSQ